MRGRKTNITYFFLKKKRYNLLRVNGEINKFSFHLLKIERIHLILI